MAQETKNIPIATPRPARPGSPLPAAPKAKARGAKGKKIANGLVALGSAAVVTVYGVGYLRTQSAADALTTNIAAESTPVAVATAAPTATTVPSATQTPAIQFPLFSPPSSGSATSPGGSTRIAPTATTVPQPTSVPRSTGIPPTATAAPTKSATASRYKDGSYVGSGSSRHGGIQATVVVQGGKIVSAEITQCGTRYSCGIITSLTQEVVAKQSAPVDFVTGATDSSQAYQGAIRTALAKAATAG